MSNVELLMEKVSNATPYDTDDWWWNDDETVIQFVILDDWGPSDRYCFVYDEEDVFERNIEEQMDDWIADKLLY